MTNEQDSQRVEALLMALLALTHEHVTRSDDSSGIDAVVFKVLSRGGIKGSEIAQIFGVSKATVSRRING